MAAASPSEPQLQASITVHATAKKSHKAAFSCTVCNAAFNRAAHLRRHQRARMFRTRLALHPSNASKPSKLIFPVIDQGEKPYSCAHCSLSSSRKDVIIRHTRNFHPNRVDDGPPTPANADGDTAQTISISSPSQDGGSTQAVLTEAHPPEGDNEPFPIFPDLSFQFPDLGLFRSGNTPFPEPSLREGPVVDVFPPNDPTNSDLWDILLASVPDITSGAPSGHAPSNLQALPVGPPLSPERTPEQVKGIFGFDNAGYEQAQANLASYDPDKKLLNFQLPSKYAVIRYVKAYYEYMDPQLPIVHGPTFDAATVPSPLLTEMMACGAVYLSEQQPAAKLHAVTLQLSSQHWQKDGPFELWHLQANILMGFFETYTAGWVTPPRVGSIISTTTKMAQQAVDATKILGVTTYQDWVCRESVNRSMVATIVLGAALNSTSGKRYFSLPGPDSKFALPAITAIWQRQEDESGWQEHADRANFHDTLKLIIAGQTPVQEIGDFGFLGLISAVLDHICSFETLASSQHPQLYKCFVTEMVKSVDVLDNMWRVRAARESMHRPMNTPLIRSAKSLLDSAYYHLYAHHQLNAMKGLLSTHESFEDQSDVAQQLFKESTESAILGKALTRAAEVLREDCRQGLKYLHKVGPYRFAPLTTTSVFEGGLLLCWYLRTRRSAIAAPDPQTTLDLLIRDAAAEVEAVQMKAVDDLSVFPLEANVEVLHDGSVWARPPAVSSKLSSLVQCLKGIP